MKLIGRHDRILVAGFLGATVVVFSGPVRYLLNVAAEVEKSSGLSLIPALVILTVVLFLQQQSKRQELDAQAAAAAAEAGQADARAHELERLVTFGQTLGRSLDFDTIRNTVEQQLPNLADSHAAWVMVRTDGRWQALVGGPQIPRRFAEQSSQSLAEQAMLDLPNAGANGAVVVDGHLCVPLSAGGEMLGVMGVPESAGPFSDVRRRSLAAMATLLAISLRNAELFREVHENSLRDGLTGCFNRTHALDAIDVDLRRSRRSHAPLSLIMFDIDHFKQINDCYGHLCGDAVLAAVGARIRDVLRGTDLTCRYGGEEFLIVLPDTLLEGAGRVAEMLRAELANMALEWKGATIRVTASFGVATRQPSELDAHALIGRADAALYQAKGLGRNRVQSAAEAAVA
jgi:diguanylate cyclase (GGDEF)-like protein